MIFRAEKDLYHRAWRRSTRLADILFKQIVKNKSQA
jgi:hypothetical protein